MGIDLVDLVNKSKAVDVKPTPMAIGVRVPRSVQDPASFLADMKDYTNTNVDVKRQIDLCNKLYRQEGTVGTAIDALVDFATTNIWAEDTGDQKLDKILAHVNENINAENTNSLPGLLTFEQEFCLEFFLSGNVFPYTTWSRVKVADTSEPVDIPTSVVLLNPNAIVIPTDKFAFGQEIIYYNPGQDVYEFLQKDGRKNRDGTSLRKGIPQNIIKQVKDGKRWDNGIALDPAYITHIKRKARSYEVWGVPYLTRVFGAVSIIKKLRKLDETTTEGLINLITLFKVGSDEHPAGADRIQSLADLLTDPAATTTLVWAHDVAIEQVGPDGKILGFKDKYKEAYDELLRGLGVPLGLMGTDSQVSWEDLLALIVKLEAWRELFVKWVEKLYRQIAVENGYKNIYPKARLERMHLTDDTAIKNMIINFYDRGLLDPETALSEAGYDFDSVLEKKKRLASEMKHFMPPELPFSGTDNRGTGKPANNGQPNPTKKKKTEQTVNLQNKGRK